MGRRHGRRSVDPDAPVVDLDRVLADDRRIDLIARRPGCEAVPDGDGRPGGRRPVDRPAGRRPSPPGDPLLDLLEQWRAELAAWPLPEVPAAPARSAIAAPGGGRAASPAPSPTTSAPTTATPTTATPTTVTGWTATAPGPASVDDGTTTPPAVEVPGGPVARPGPRRAGRCPGQPGRTAGRRTWRPGLAVAAAIGAVLVGSATIGAAEAEPGSPLWPITQMVWPARAQSVESTRQVEVALAEARTALATGRSADARRAILRAEMGLAGISDAAVRDSVRSAVTQLWAQTQTPRSSRTVPDGTKSARSSLVPSAGGSVTAGSTAALAPTPDAGSAVAADVIGAVAGPADEATGGAGAAGGSEAVPPVGADPAPAAAGPVVATPAPPDATPAAQTGIADGGTGGAADGVPSGVPSGGSTAAAAPATVPDPSEVVQSPGADPDAAAPTSSSTPVAAQQPVPTPPPSTSDESGKDPLGPAGSTAGDTGEDAGGAGGGAAGESGSPAVIDGAAAPGDGAAVSTWTIRADPTG